MQQDEDLDQLWVRAIIANRGADAPALIVERFRRQALPPIRDAAAKHGGLSEPTLLAIGGVDCPVTGGEEVLMNVYKITGAISVMGWPQVRGDNLVDVFDGVDKPFRVDQVVVAETPQAALDALRTIPGALPDTSVWWDEDEDLSALTVEPAPPHIAMQALGMPTLFDMEAPHA